MQAGKGIVEGTFQLSSTCSTIALTVSYICPELTLELMVNTCELSHICTADEYCVLSG